MNVTRCYRCLCDACNSLNCPYRRDPLDDVSKLNFCIRSVQLERCPVRQCDFYAPKFRRSLYKVKLRKKKVSSDDRLNDAVYELVRRIIESSSSK